MHILPQVYKLPKPIETGLGAISYLSFSTYIGPFQALSIQLLDSNRDLVALLSTNLPNAMPLNCDSFYANDSILNNKVLTDLISQGLVTALNIQARSNFNHYHAYKLTPDFVKQLKTKDED